MTLKEDYDNFCKNCVNKVLCVPELRKNTTNCPVYNFIQFINTNSNITDDLPDVITTILTKEEMKLIEKYRRDNK